MADESDSDSDNEADEASTMSTVPWRQLEFMDTKWMYCGCCGCIHSSSCMYVYIYIYIQQKCDIGYMYVYIYICILE